MEDNKQISDELLAKYLSDKASAEEEERILCYLAENDENLEDFLTVATAAKMQYQEEQTSEKHHHYWIKWVAAAAAVVAFLLVGVFAFQHNGSDDNYLAEEQHGQDDQITEETAANDTTDSAGATSVSQVSTWQSIAQPQVNEPKHYADSAKKKNYTIMIYPSSQLTSVSENLQSMNFRWNTDAVEIHLLVKTENENTLVDQKLGTAKYYKLTLPKDVDTLRWQATFTYSDGKSQVKKGKIIRWDMGVEKNKQLNHN